MRSRLEVELVLRGWQDGAPDKICEVTNKLASIKSNVLKAWNLKAQDGGLHGTAAYNMPYSQ